MPFRRIRRRHTVAAGAGFGAYHTATAAAAGSSTNLIPRCRSTELSSDQGVNPCEHLQKDQKAEEVRAMRAMTTCVIRCCLQLLTYILQLITTLLDVAILSSDKSEKDDGDDKEGRVDTLEPSEINEDVLEKLQQQTFVTTDIVQVFNTYDDSAAKLTATNKIVEGEEELDSENELMAVLLRKAASKQQQSRDHSLLETRTLPT